MSNSKYQTSEDFFNFLIKEFGYSIFKEPQRCIAISSDMLESKKQIDFLLKTAFNNNVYIELLKAKDSSSENKLIYIERAIKILTDNCGIDKEKATNVVGWLATVIYPNEWNIFISKQNKKEIIFNQLKQTNSNHFNKNTPIQKTSTITTSVNNYNTNYQNNNLDQKNWTLKDIGLEMVYCPAGSFMMGSPAPVIKSHGFLGFLKKIEEGELGRNNDETQHQVIISKPFYIGKYPITQKQYEIIMNDNPSNLKKKNKPISNVTWNKARKFCRKLNTIYRNIILQGYQFALPTEAQWEYACRAGTTTALNNSKNLTTTDGICPNLEEVGWYLKNSGGKTHTVGQKKPNKWGIYDMHGNVEEWCYDKYNDYTNTTETDPVVLDGSFGEDRVLRGGGISYASACRSSSRNHGDPNTNNGSFFSYSYNGYGFRVVLVPIEWLKRY